MPKKENVAVMPSLKQKGLQIAKTYYEQANQSMLRQQLELATHFSKFDSYYLAVLFNHPQLDKIALRKYLKNQNISAADIHKVISRLIQLNEVSLLSKIFEFGFNLPPEFKSLSTWVSNPYIPTVLDRANDSHLSCLSYIAYAAALGKRDVVNLFLDHPKCGTIPLAQLRVVLYCAVHGGSLRLVKRLMKEIERVVGSKKQAIHYVTHPKTFYKGEQALAHWDSFDSLFSCAIKYQQLHLLKYLSRIVPFRSSMVDFNDLCYLRCQNKKIFESFIIQHQLGRVATLGFLAETNCLRAIQDILDYPHPIGMTEIERALVGAAKYDNDKVVRYLVNKYDFSQACLEEALAATLKTTQPAIHSMDYLFKRVTDKRCFPISDFLKTAIRLQNVRPLVTYLKYTHFDRDERTEKRLSRFLEKAMRYHCRSFVRLLDKINVNPQIEEDWHIYFKGRALIFNSEVRRFREHIKGESSGCVSASSGYTLVSSSASSASSSVTSDSYSKTNSDSYTSSTDSYSSSSQVCSPRLESKPVARGRSREVTNIYGSRHKY